MLSNLLLKEDLKNIKSKTIGDDVIDRMISQYEPPTLDEGFDEIIVAPHY